MCDMWNLGTFQRICILVRVLIEVKRYHDQVKSTLTKASISLGLVYSFRCLIHYHHSRKYGTVKADMVLEKELRVLHLGSKATRRHWHP